MQFMAKQRNISQPVKPQQPQNTISSFRSLQPEQVGKVTNIRHVLFVPFIHSSSFNTQFLQYRALKLESTRKNLIYQKKFLSQIVQELDQNHNQRIESKCESKKPCRRFRYVYIRCLFILATCSDVKQKSNVCFVSGSSFLPSYRFIGCAT